MTKIDGEVLTYASNKWIACSGRWTPAYRCMVEDATHGSVATSSRAWVYALVAHAGAISGTLRADHALGPASCGGCVTASATGTRAHGTVTDH